MLLPRLHIEGSAGSRVCRYTGRGGRMCRHVWLYDVKRGFGVRVNTVENRIVQVRCFRYVVTHAL